MTPHLSKALGLHVPLQTRFVGAQTSAERSTRGRKLGRVPASRAAGIVGSCSPDKWVSSRPTGMLAALRFRPAECAGLFFSHRVPRHAETHLSGEPRALIRLLAVLRGRSGGLPSFLPRVVCRNSRCSLNQEIRITDSVSQTTKEFS